MGVSIAVPVYFAKAKILTLASATAWPYVISFSVILIVMTVVVTMLFAKRHSGAACVALFCGIAVLTAHHYTGLSNLLNSEQQIKQTRRFALKVAEMVPVTDKLVSYKSVPATFVHYFGRTAEKVQSEAELNSLYQQNYWVVSFGKEMDELLKTGRYKLMYMDPGANKKKQGSIAGGLFHGNDG